MFPFYGHRTSAVGYAEPALSLIGHTPTHPQTLPFGAYFLYWCLLFVLIINCLLFENSRLVGGYVPWACPLTMDGRIVLGEGGQLAQCQG
jgi:hypothetical protein